MRGDLFSDSELELREKFFLFERRLKLVTFVPPAHTDKLIKVLSKSGAGVIGNYEMCSFRSFGTGTFKPNERARPFSGSRRILSSEDEYRLEMECSFELINKVIDSLLKHHPYEEVAYELYEFMKREKEDSGVIYRLRKPLMADGILSRLNKMTANSNIKSDMLVRSVVFTNKAITSRMLHSVKFSGSDMVIRKSNKSKKFEIITIQQ